jgi:shikimate dehydrogenase
VKEIYTLTELQNWKKSGKSLVRLGVLGDPVEHSLSPQMQNAALRDSGIKMEYARFHVRPPELAEAFDLVRRNEFIGFNVTLPHKQAGAGLVDESDADAKQIGAINTIALRDGKLVGFNTDGHGFARAVREEFSVDLRDLRILVLGAGGAARAIAFECARQNCERLVIANRTRANAEKLVHDLVSFFAGPRVLGPVARLQAVGLSEAELRMQIPNTDLIVNATSVGLQRSDSSIIPAHVIEPHLMIYDTVYGPGRTPLLLAAAEMGARGATGLSMLLHQGARAFELWFGREAPVAAMRSALQAAA